MVLQFVTILLKLHLTVGIQTKRPSTLSKVKATARHKLHKNGRSIIFDLDGPVS